MELIKEILAIDLNKIKDTKTRKIVASNLYEGIKEASVKIEQPVMLCTMNVRRHLKNLCDRFQVQTTIFSHNEIPSGLEIQSVSDVSTKA